jgi:glycosyltransferase involved in cell wall biosynthesis
MDERPALNVAILLPTYNGARFVETQIESLRQNSVQFSLHWLDDFSTDTCREVVRGVAAKSGIPLHEWHQPEHLGYPVTFFRLMECVEADIYLFCDQDDIWQPGKIDAIVADLLPDLTSPVLCYSDPWIFWNEHPTRCYRLSEVAKVSVATYCQDSRLFTYNPAIGHTIGFTRPLRELFLTHKDIACRYACVHDAWLHLIAVVVGTTRTLRNTPTTLYRIHENNTLAGDFFGRRRGGVIGVIRKWKLFRSVRMLMARQARGFMLASSVLPGSPKLTRLLSMAKFAATLDRRQTLAEVVRLAHLRMLPAIRANAFWIVVTSLFTDAEE